jgi:ABC-2 type transport system permease protein
VAAIVGSRSARTPTDRTPLLAVLRSEFLKLRSVRSTYWTLLAAMAFNVLLAVLVAVFIPGALSAQDKHTVDAIRLSLAGMHLSQIAVGVLGVLVITGEYGTGMIRATFGAVPQRRAVLVAKAIVFAVTALIVGVVSCFAAYFAFDAIVTDPGLQSSIDDPGVLRAVTGGGLYLAVLGLLGLGLGGVIRSTAGSIAVLFGLLFVPPILLELLPRTWQSTVGPYLPMQAGSQIFIAQERGPDDLGAWTGMGVFTLCAAIAVAASLVLVDRRDA